MECFTKKIVASLLCLGLLLSVVTGCNKTEKTSSNISTGADLSDVDSDESNIEGITSDNENVSEKESSSTGQTGTTSKPGTTNKPGTTQSTTNSGNINLKGKEILVKSVMDNAFGAWVEPVDPEDESAEQKVMRQWRENFEKKYNCKQKLKDIRIKWFLPACGHTFSILFVIFWEWKTILLRCMRIQNLLKPLQNGLLTFLWRQMMFSFAA